MKYYLSHPLSWPHLPEGFGRDHDSAWTWLPNTLYDPEKGRALYEESLTTLALADELGYDGVCLGEHHQTAYSLTPSPNLLAAALTQRTKRCRLAVIHCGLSLDQPPLRLAEEVALLDALSGGRLDVGLGVAGGPEYWSSQANPTHARERFREGLDLALAAWTRPGPFTWTGKHYFYRYVNPWPTPVQKPHPPVWIAGDGSPEMAEVAAQGRFVYVGSPYLPLDSAEREFGRFREACQKAGTTASPGQLAWTVPIHVAETDRQAREEFEPHLWYLVKNLLKGKATSPPGARSPHSALASLRNRGESLAEKRTWDEVERGGYVIVGGAATVRQKLDECRKRLGCGVVLAGCPARKGMELLAREVLPHVRDA